MGALDFTQKYWWKNFIHKLYSWGASVVLVGALFKITHWPGATIMLTVGLLTEAVIFFFSGIEPPHEEIDWTLVYPELKVKDIEDEDILSQPQVSSGRRRNEGNLPAPSVEALEKFNTMLDKAGEEGLFEKLHTGLNKMNSNLEKMSDITDASVATKEFSDKVKQASEKVSDLSATYEQSNNEFKTVADNFNSSVKSAADKLNSSVNSAADSITYSAESVNDAFNKTSQTIEKQNENIENAYSSLANSMDIDFSSVANGNEEYNKKISLLNKNLTAINAIFEMQLGEANLDQMVKDISDSAEYAKKYSTEISKLSKNLSALNDVYGKMLSAMNVKID